MATGDSITFDFERSTVTTPSDHRPVQITIPRELGPVRLIKEVGRGGMGIVYLGRHELLSRDVAVKFLLGAEGGSQDPGFARFLDGARAAAAVRHEGLTTIHHADVVDDIPYLVLEYIDGPTLTTLLRRCGRFCPGTALAVLAGVSAAIGELHDQGIIHRDIKSSNVLLNRRGRTFVTDFGLACSNPAGTTGSFIKGMAGTPAYMSPEMFDGTLSTRSDVYALGIMMFQLLAGCLPFTGTLEELGEKHRNDPLPVDLLEKHDVEHALIDITQRAAHKNPLFRYKTARQFLRALDPHIASVASSGAGEMELEELVTRVLDESPEDDSEKPTQETEETEYFQRLSQIAAAKRSQSPTADREEPDESDGAVERRVEDDLPCVGCGYNLRTLLSDGNCPECGLGVRRSLLGDLLPQADEAWLFRICRGQALTYAGCLALVSFLFIPIIVTSLPATLSSVAPLQWLFTTTLVVLLAAAPMMLVVGVFMVTLPDPRTSLTEQPLALRRIARWAVVVLLVFGGLPELALSVFGGTTFVSAALAAWGVVSGSVMILAFVAVVLGLCHYLAELAQRIPDTALALRSNQLARRFAGVTTLALAAWWAMKAWGGGVATTLPAMALHMAEAVLVLASVYYVVRVMGLMSTYRKAFKRCLLARKKVSG